MFAPSVVWIDKDGERSVGLGGLHKLLTQDPTLGFAVLHEGVEAQPHVLRVCTCSSLVAKWKCEVGLIWGSAVHCDVVVLVCCAFCM